MYKTRWSLFLYKTRWSLFQILHTTLHCVKIIHSLFWKKRCIVLFSLIKQITPDSAADIIEKKENTFAFRHFFMCDDFLLQHEYLTLGIKYLVRRHRLGICFLDLYKNLLMILMCTNCILDISCKQSWTMRLGFFCTVRRVIFKATLTINYYSPRSISVFFAHEQAE